MAAAAGKCSGLILPRLLWLLLLLLDFFLPLGGLGLAKTLSTVCLYPGGSGMFAIRNSSLQFIPTFLLPQAMDLFVSGRAGLTHPPDSFHRFPLGCVLGGHVAVHGCPALGTQPNLLA